MKFFTAITKALSFLLLSTAVSATLSECEGKSDTFTIQKVSYIFDGNRVCVTIQGYLEMLLPFDTNMTLEFSHGDKSDRWTVPFYSDMDSAATTDIPVSKGERKVTPCFFLPASFGTLKPDSQVKVTLTGNLSTNNSEILCVTGYITTK